MSTTYPLTADIEITEQSSRFTIDVRLPLDEHDLDFDWHHSSSLSGYEVLHAAAEMIKAASYSMGEEGRDKGREEILEALS